MPDAAEDFGAISLDLVHHAYDAIVVKGLEDGAITFWSRGAERLYGYSAEEAAGRVSHELLRTEFPVPLADIDHALHADGAWSGELVHMTRDGKLVWVQSRWALVPGADGNPVAALEVNRDVTAERNLATEQQELLAILERQNTELRAKDRLKSEFLLTISHELRTPLTAILGFTDLLILDSPIAVRPELEIIQRNGRRLLMIIEDVLILAQAQAGELKLRLRPVNIAGVVRRMAETEKDDAHEKGLALEIPTSSPVWVIADQTAAGHVVRHLVANAIKFTDEGYVRVDIAREDGRVKVTVEDTGVGVPPAARDVIFDRFRQADQSATRRYGGAGVGLAVVRDLIGLQGGELGFDDRPGGGSRFWFTLPAEVAATDEELARAE